MNCVECSVPFPLNSELASIPDASKIAFDPAQNRVWRICDGCGAWNLLGPEASRAAVPELNARFAAGTVEQYQDMGRSVIGSMQLIRLEAEREADTDPLITALRHDPAVKKRMRRLRLGAAAGMIFFLGYSYSTINNLWRMIHGLYLSFLASPVPYALGFGAIVLVCGAMVLAKNLRSGSTRLRGRSLAWNFVASVLVTSLGVGGIVFVMTELWSDGGLLFSELGSFASAAMLGVALTSAQVTSQVNLRRMRLWSAAGLALTVLVGVIQPEEFFPMMWIPLVGSVALGGVLGLSFRILRHRRRLKHEAKGTVDIGIWSYQDCVRVQLAWSEAGDTISLHQLPGGESIDGRRAKLLLHQILIKRHGIEGPGHHALVAGEKFLRAAGGLAGILRSLNQYRDDQDGTIVLLQLPLVTRVALDLGLTEEAQHATREIQHLRDQAEDAADVAKVAESIDRELLHPHTT